MAVISAEEGALRRGADAVRDAHTAITDRKRKVADEVAAAGYWTGKAADDFKLLMENWNTKADGLLKTLSGLEDALRGSESDAAAQEEEVSSNVSKLASGMSGI